MRIFFQPFPQILLLMLFTVSGYAQPMLISPFAFGGDGDNGTIVAYSAGNTSLSSIKNIPSVAGKYPNGSLIQATNGKFYGMTSESGYSEINSGVIFEYDVANNTYTKKVNFEGYNGGNPQGTLIQASNGKLYGMTMMGGSFDIGVIFEYDFVTNVFSKKFDFSVSNGYNPKGSFVQASNGKLYGMTDQGGVNGQGVIFEYDVISGVYIKKVDLSGENGINPLGSMIEASNGKLYGVAKGGTLGSGVIFEYDFISNVYTKKFDFSGVNGVNPLASLLYATNGKLYGTTQTGGANNLGVIFEYDPFNNIYIKRFEFSSTDGFYPQAPLIQASNGKLYGMTLQGGNNDEGLIFEYDITSNSYMKRVDFSKAIGRWPQSSLIEGTNGKLYGMTPSGGINDFGVIFEYEIANNVYTKKIEFNRMEGAFPAGALIQASNGKLYGTTVAGGYDGIDGERGVIYEYDLATNLYTKKIEFTSANGSNSYSSLIQASNGKLYGTTVAGGSNDGGVIFEYDFVSNVYTKKVDFTGIDGSRPISSLIQGSNGNLYGTTINGGDYGFGVIFEYNPLSGIYTKKFDFPVGDGYSNGTLLQASNGNLYGTTGFGGINGAGIIFEYNIGTDTYTKKVDLTEAEGKNPSGLIQATNGKLYGMTNSGGLNGEGVIFEYDFNSNTYTKKFDFMGTNGINPSIESLQASLFQASNGKLYGMTAYGGANNKGVIFEYDFLNNVFSKKIDLSLATGFGSSGSFVEVLPVVSLPSPVISSPTGTYPEPISVSITCTNPSATIYYTTSGNLPVIGTGFTKVYSGPFQQIQSGTIRAMAVLSGLPNSKITTSFITITNPGIAANPVISPGSGSYAGAQTITLSTTTSGASIYYTTNGNAPLFGVPNSFTKLYSSPFQINSTATIRAVAVKSGLENSAVSVANIIITNPTALAATPIISPSTGIYAGSQNVSVSCATLGATIYYTTSGNTPVIGAGFTKVYSGSFNIASSTTVRAMATAPGMLNSAVAVSFITIGPGRVAVNEGFDEEMSEAIPTKKLRAYPNPTSDVVNLVSSELLENARVEVFGSIGQSVLKMEVAKLENERLSLFSLPTGIYSLKITATGFEENIRILKQ